MNSRDHGNLNREGNDPLHNSSFFIPRSEVDQYSPDPATEMLFLDHPSAMDHKSSSMGDLVLKHFLWKSDGEHNRSTALAIKYKDNLEALAVIWEWLSPECRNDLWENMLVPGNLEIEFLSALNPIDHDFRKHHDIKLVNRDKKTKALIKKYKDSGYKSLLVILDVLLWRPK